MLNLMFKDKNIEIDTFEIDSNKENYTIYTVEYLLKKYKNSRLMIGDSFLVGAQRLLI